jgi:twitching motility protein PilT
MRLLDDRNIRVGLDELGFRKEVLDAWQEEITAANGIILVTGPTGCGKTTTLYSLLKLADRDERNIVTVEDPIEYDLQGISQSQINAEIGMTFANGLRATLRQDPDVILVGEMRDRDTFETALQASETGHLVFGTLHASNAQQAVQRLFEFFPEERKQSLQRQLAGALRATITQKLLAAMEGGGRIPVSEVFVLDALGRKTIQDGKFEKIEAVIEASEDNGSKTFNQDLFRLVKAGVISKDDAIDHSPNPRQLEMNLKGIFLSSGGIIN